MDVIEGILAILVLLHIIGPILYDIYKEEEQEDDRS